MLLPEGSDDPGEEFEPLGIDWIGELLMFHSANNEDLETDLEERLAEIKARG